MFRYPILLLGVVFLASVPAASTEEEARIEFVHVEPRHGTLVSPFGFRLVNAVLLQQAREARGEGDTGVVRAKVAVMAMVNAEPFQVFTLFAEPVGCVKARTPSTNGTIDEFMAGSREAAFYQCLHFAENSSDLVGQVELLRLDPGRHTVTLKVIDPDCFSWLTKEEFVFNEACELLGVDSEPWFVDVTGCDGTCQPLQPLHPPLAGACSSNAFFWNASFAVEEEQVLQRQGTLCNSAQVDHLILTRPFSILELILNTMIPLSTMMPLIE